MTATIAPPALPTRPTAPTGKRSPSQSSRLREHRRYGRRLLKKPSALWNEPVLIRTILPNRWVTCSITGDKN